MSTQSVLELNRETYFQESQDNLIALSDAYYFKKKLEIGQSLDRDKMRFYMQSNRFLCEDNCQLVDYIKDKIEGKLLDCNVRINKKQRVSEILKIAKQHLDIGDCSDCVPTWNEVAW